MKCTNQISNYEIFAKHEIADELIKISNWPNAHYIRIGMGRGRHTLYTKTSASQRRDQPDPCRDMVANQSIAH